MFNIIDIANIELSSVWWRPKKSIRQRVLSRNMSVLQLYKSQRTNNATASLFLQRPPKSCDIKSSLPFRHNVFLEIR